MKSHQHSRTPGPDILEKKQVGVSKKDNIYEVDKCPVFALTPRTAALKYSFFRRRKKLRERLEGKTN